MPSASAIRQRIEAALAERIPSALTPQPRIVRPVSPTGISAVDEALAGGLPMGTITEMTGPECSGRTGLALSFLAQATAAGKVCAWVDATDCLQPESAAAMGVDLSRLLWVRCGVINPEQQPAKRFELPEKCFIPPPVTKGLHGGGFGPHPRTEMQGLSDAIPDLFSGPGRTEPQWRDRGAKAAAEPGHSSPKPNCRKQAKPWARIEQALRAVDLLLQAGGFNAIVLDMGSIAPEYASRVPLATWFRYRASAERTQASILLLTQHACAKSSAGLVLRFNAGTALCDERTVFTGARYSVAVNRERFAPVAANVVPMRKPPQGVRAAEWRSRAAWAGGR
ncbi:MAG TPA: recombinase RecA [Acidobacteriaceae bacterium]|nr:recombinase RecA [Acidobacteriaceae bacterium]